MKAHVRSCRPSSNSIYITPDASLVDATRNQTISKLPDLIHHQRSATHGNSLAIRIRGGQDNKLPIDCV